MFSLVFNDTVTCQWCFVGKGCHHFVLLSNNTKKINKVSKFIVNQFKSLQRTDKQQFQQITKLCQTIRILFIKIYSSKQF